MNINRIKSTKDYINNMHESMKNFTIYDDSSNDICVTFRRKVCYGSTSCAWNTYFYDKFCFLLNDFQYNYLLLTKISYNSLKNFGDFKNKFLSFDKGLNEKI